MIWIFQFGFELHFGILWPLSAMTFHLHLWSMFASGIGSSTFHNFLIEIDINNRVGVCICGEFTSTQDEIPTPPAHSWEMVAVCWALRAFARLNDIFGRFSTWILFVYNHLGRVGVKRKKAKWRWRRTPPPHHGINNGEKNALIVCKGKYQVYNRSCAVHCVLKMCLVFVAICVLRSWCLSIYRQRNRNDRLQKLGNQSSSITMRYCFLLTNTNPTKTFGTREKKKTHTKQSKARKKNTTHRETNETNVKIREKRRV